jgi:hypothetical protein
LNPPQLAVLVVRPLPAPAMRQVALELRKPPKLNQTSLSQLVHDQKNGRLEKKIKAAEK